jgi:hypothetical protein
MLAAAVTCSALLTGASAAAASRAAAAGGGVWGTAKEVPGIAALNKGGNAAVWSVSCGSAGNCSAVGPYTDGSGHLQVFVVDEKNGTWGTAKEIPGTAALNKGGTALSDSVSCGSAGNCSAGGLYTDSSGHIQALVVSQVNGTWGTAKEVPGTAALNKGGTAETGQVSCRSAGNCTTGGGYTDSSGHHQAYVVSEVNGTWGTAKPIPSIAALNKGGNAGIDSVSCASAGNCSAGGSYTDGSGHLQVFVIAEVQGTWGTAKEVPGTAALNKGGLAEFNGTGLISCASAGNCSAGGFYSDAKTHDQAFVDGERNGTWGTAKEVPGLAVLNVGILPDAETLSVSCGAVGNCGAGGFYNPASALGLNEAFVVSEVNGTWGTAIQAPGITGLDHGWGSEITSVSCPSAGNCTAGGNYTDSSSRGRVFVIGEVNGTWGTATEVPGTAALNKGGNAGIYSVSCASAAHCSAGGTYADTSGSQEHLQAFVVSET